MKLRFAALPLLALVACGTGDEPDRSAQAASAANPANWAYSCAPEPGRVVAPGMTFGDPTGCNQCSCEDRLLSCANGVCTGLICTAAACLTLPLPGASSSFPACTSSADCGAGECLFDAGCTNPVGRCVAVQVSDSMGSAQSYCSCAGVTVDGSAPREPYAHAGPC